jgi:hypothetical protein
MISDCADLLLLVVAVRSPLSQLELALKATTLLMAVRGGLVLHAEKVVLGRVGGIVTDVHRSPRSITYSKATTEEDRSNTRSMFVAWKVRHRKGCNYHTKDLG